MRLGALPAFDEETAMAYVNERISDDDMVKYRIAETSWPHRVTHFRDWVIDRDRDIYLRRANDDRGETTNEYWSFYWMGYEWAVWGYRLSYEPKTGSRPAQYSVKLRFTKFPETLQSRIDQVRADFMEAYRADLFNKNLEIAFTFE
jgi:hypothetical protein